MKTELKIGLFAIIVLLILSYMTFKVGGIGIWKKGYRLYVFFDTVSGLDEKSRIKIAGVDSGMVERIRLKEGKAELTLLINPDVKIYEDAKASLKVTGLLGDRYLAIWRGSHDKTLLRDGDTIKNTEPPFDIDEFATKLANAATYISELAGTFEEIFGEKQREALSQSIDNLNIIVTDLKEILKENRTPFHNTLVKLETFSETLGDKAPGLVEDISKSAKDIRELIEENKEKVKESVENIKDASKSISNIVQKLESGEGTIGRLLKDRELYDSLNNIIHGLESGEGTAGKLLKDEKLYDSFTNIAQRLEKGEGTLGKLLKDEQLYKSIDKVVKGAGKTFDAMERLRIFMDFRGEYLSKENDWKGHFNLTLQPRADKFYILGVVSDPIGKTEITETTLNGTTITEEKIKRKIEFTALFVKRFEDFALRIGMIENTFGLGTDYYLAKDKVRMSFSAWDIRGEEARANNAHLKIGIDYKFFKHFFISGGLDNIINDNRRGMYIGAGLEFEDEDFKYIFGSAPAIKGP